MSHENVLPKAVQAQAAAADEIIKQVYAPEEPEETPEDPKPEDASGQEPPAEPAQPPAESEFEHKFKVLQGKYNAAQRVTRIWILKNRPICHSDLSGNRLKT